MSDLDVCAMQGPSLPNKDEIDPRVGASVVVNRGYFKGYRGRITNVGSEAIDVQLEALMVANKPTQSFQWRDLE